MNVIAKESTDLVAINVLTPAAVFAPGGVEAILSKIEAEVRSQPTDISTSAGRSAVASLAYKVARSKTALDEMGKDLVAEWKAKANAVDAERRVIRERLDALKDEVRKPLTDWENAEKERVAAHETAIAQIQALTVFAEFEPSSALISDRQASLRSLQGRDWQEFAKRGCEAETAAAAALDKMFATAKKREDEAAELARLRAEQVEREQREREERIAAEAAERARKEAEAKAEAEAAAAAEAARKEQERIELEKAEAEERARKAEADRIAAIEKAEADRKAAAEAAERERIAAVEAERKRIADEEAAARAEQAKREADKKHRAKVNGEARAALIAIGLPEDFGTAVVAAIARGEIPHVKITY